MSRPPRPAGVSSRRPPSPPPGGPAHPRRGDRERLPKKAPHRRAVERGRAFSPARPYPGALRARADFDPTEVPLSQFVFLSGEPVLVREGRDPGSERLGDELGPVRVLWIDGEALPQLVAGGLGGSAKSGDLGPWGFRVDVVDR